MSRQAICGSMSLRRIAIEALRTDSAVAATRQPLQKRFRSSRAPTIGSPAGKSSVPAAQQIQDSFNAYQSRMAEQLEEGRINATLRKIAEPVFCFPSEPGKPYVPPARMSFRKPEGLSMTDYAKTLFTDIAAKAMSFQAKRTAKSILGKAWKTELETAASELYILMSQALASGQLESLTGRVTRDFHDRLTRQITQLNTRTHPYRWEQIGSPTVKIIAVENTTNPDFSDPNNYLSETAIRVALRITCEQRLVPLAGSPALPSSVQTFTKAETNLLALRSIAIPGTRWKLSGYAVERPALRDDELADNLAKMSALTTR
ncbi:uncharacterized protein L969DRAFT_93799 [Mixia osmundae IAM 14324]|uniref:Tim44-like domain-containing protein n=1 Tax=Mixia osmundae (strain CBS 9802 / IAM 14324 / JCM 22182 / KY 12970) TaxID=764103 RepID=G7E9L9_MIXOS|nr:uncharacterized protein L969DRAFT_93799 [Mixia osmundae IAM 14324]KEI39968.1 hypothetical protein L969DRAFT_93799 [Mixia osmundae IAM 14324]GAA99338.1 hypothetical protein E5Q_06033 [Mixia osmundae IAM 14324]